MFLVLLAGTVFAATPADAIASAVASRAGVPVTDVEVRELGLSAEWLAQDADWVVDLPVAQTRFAGATPVVLRQGATRFPLRPRVVTYAEIPVAASSVKSGEPVVLATARIASDRLRSEEPVPAGAWVARVAIAAGEPVTTARARRAPDLADGADVKVLAGAGPLRVAAPGKLMEDAYVGAPVSVLNLATRAVLHGTYRGEHVVVLETP